MRAAIGGCEVKNSYSEESFLPVLESSAIAPLVLQLHSLQLWVAKVSPPFSLLYHHIMYTIVERQSSPGLLQWLEQ